MLPVMTATMVPLPIQGSMVTIGLDQVLPDRLKSWQQVIAQLPACDPVKGPWIAGGAVRRFFFNTDPFQKDLDYFCASREQFDILCARVECQEATLLKVTKDHATYLVTLPTGSVTIQIVKTRFRPSLEAHLMEFDFTLCQTGWNGRQFVFSVRAYHHLGDRLICLAGPIHSVSGSWLRLLKYAQQGFTIHPSTITSLVERAIEEGDDSDGTYA